MADKECQACGANQAMEYRTNGHHYLLCVHCRAAIEWWDTRVTLELCEKCPPK